MELNKNIYKLYFAIFFQNLIPAYVIERLFWQGRGMDVQMVVYCEIIYAIVVVVLEIPSGIFADLLGRKRLILIGGILAVIEFVLLIYAAEFWHFGLVTFLAGIGKASTSGAWNSLLYDSLAASDSQRQFEKIVGRMRAADFTAALLAALLGGLTAYYFGYVFNYQISVAASIIALIAMLALKEPPIINHDSSVGLNFMEIIQYTYSFFKKNINVLLVILQISIIAACFNYVDEFWQIYLEDIAFPVAVFGFISAILMIVRIPGAMISGWLLRFFRPQAILIGATFLVASGIITAAIVKSVFGIAGIAVACFALEAMQPVSIGYIHHRADERARATIESVSSLLERGFVILVGLIFGYAASSMSIFSGFWILGGICIATCILFIIIYGFHNIQENKH